MASFGELLVAYTARAGISDAELARSTGVQRQTIFRWKEGLVARPRYREDVLRIAAKLRLTPDERDELLLAAGFPPEAVNFVPERTPAAVPPAHSLPGAEEPAGAAQVPASSGLPTGEMPPSPGGELGGAPDSAGQLQGSAPAFPFSSGPRPARLVPRPWLLLGVAGAIMLLVAGLGPLVLARVWPQPTPTPVVVTLAVAPTATTAPTPTPIVAAPGEKLVLVAPFVGYTSEELRFNVAGRIQEALTTEFRKARLTDARIVLWSTPLTTAEQAAAVLGESGAAMLIWGEYDAGRVRASVATAGQNETAWVNPVDSPASLPLVINQDVPQAARVFALLALGRLYREEHQLEPALTAFEGALTLNPTDPATAAALHFYVGLLLPQVNNNRVTALTAAIGHYSETLRLQPEWINALYNRGTAYLGRALLSSQEQPDLNLALADLNAVVAAEPRRTDPLLNRGIVYYQRRGFGDLDAALADFTEAIGLRPADYRGYYHRGLLAIRRGEASGWQADLARVLQLNPDFAAARTAQCWGYALSGEVEAGLAACEAAVAADVTGSSLDGRAILYAALGRTDEAAEDLAGYLEWVRQAYPGLYEKYRGREAETWLAALQRGENPFTPEVLAGLR